MAQQITITIDTGNAAFEDGAGGSEVARILRTLADRYENDGLWDQTHTLRDINGNRVGKATIAED